MFYPRASAPTKTSPLAALLSVLLLAISAYTLPASAAEKTEKAKPKPEDSLLPLDDLRTFTRVYDHVRTGYVDELSDSKLLEYAIKGMIAELDPHSAYLDKAAYAELQANTSGEFGGVGLEVGMDDGLIKVIAPLDGSPAQRAGVKPGDTLVRIDDSPMKGKTLSDASRLLRGAKDSTVKITLQRKGVDDPFDITLTREIIHVQSVTVKMLDEEYSYIRIAQFQSNTGRDFQDRLKETLRVHPKTKGLIMDLRNNPGGVLQASVDVADAFLDGGLVVYTKGRMENSSINYNASSGDMTNGIPLVVLINSGTASASEILAGALQDHKRAVIMGTRSFGKGSVQTVIPISEERAIKLTTALYYTPNGRSIQAKGIEPDVRLQKSSTANSRPAISEADLAGHIANKDGQDINSNNREKDANIADDILKDDQVMDALNLLKGSHILGSQNLGDPLKNAQIPIAPNGDNKASATQDKPRQ